MVLPILASVGVAMKTNPLLLMIPATLSASCAFMMPVASPTQAIVFSSGWVPIRDMVRAGIWFNVIGVALVIAVFSLLAQPVMGIDMRLHVRKVEFAHVGLLEDEMVLGVKPQPIEDIRIERHYLDLLDQFEQDLVLGVLPDEIASLSHASPGGIGRITI